jgi:hypothetical protein
VVRRTSAILALAIGLNAAACYPDTRDCGTVETVTLGMYIDPAKMRAAVPAVRCLADAHAARAPARFVKRHVVGTHDVLFDGFAFQIHVESPMVDLTSSTAEWAYVGPLDVACERLERRAPPSYAALEGDVLVITGCSDRRVHLVEVGFLPRDPGP